MIERIKKSFSVNPLAWILGGLCIISVYSNYRIGAEFEEACLMFQSLNEQFLDFETLILIAKKPRKLHLPISVALWQEHEKLIKAETPEGERYRALYIYVRELEKICMERLSEPERDPRENDS